MLGSDNANYRNQTLHDVDAGYVLHHFAAEVLSGLRPAERSNGRRGDRARSSSPAAASAAYFPIKKLCSSRYVASGACSEG